MIDNSHILRAPRHGRDFGTWLLQRLEEMPSRDRYGSAKMRLWVIFRELLTAYDLGPLTPEMDAYMCDEWFDDINPTPVQAAQVPEWLRQRLRAIEFTEQEIDALAP